MIEEKEVREMFTQSKTFLNELNTRYITNTDKEEAKGLKLLSMDMFARLQVMAWVLDEEDLKAEDFI